MRRRNLVSLALLGATWSMTACNTAPTKSDAPSPASAPTSTTTQEPATVALAAPAQATAPAAGAKAPAGYDQAMAALRDGLHDDAIKSLSDITGRHPDFAPAHINLGIAHFGAKQWERARNALLRALELDADNPVALNYLGMTYRELGRFAEAGEAYKRAMHANSRYAYAYLNMGILSDLYLGNPQDALDYYQQYQTLTGGSDKEVNQWVVELQRRMQQSEKGTP